MHTRIALAVLSLSLLLALVAFACSQPGASDAVPVAEAGPTGVFESGYGGGVFVVPGSDAQSGAGTGTGYGGIPYGGSPDGAPASSPCPLDAAANARESGTEGLDTGADGGDADAACTAPLAPGDLVIDELMIASQSGTGDHGEWVEVTSTRSCAINLNGLYAEVPHGQGTTMATVASDLWLPAYGSFLIADSSSAALNHDLPSVIVTWGTGTSSDVLKNSGNTITLFTTTATIDALTYTATAKLVEGASMAFPSHCDPALRADFHNWQASLASWTPGFFGTPDAPNTDVSCAIAPPPPPPSTPPCAGTSIAPLAGDGSAGGVGQGPGNGGGP
jgi:hypothetical protein